MGKQVENMCSNDLKNQSGVPFLQPPLFLGVFLGSSSRPKQGRGWGEKGHASTKPARNPRIATDSLCPIVIKPNRISIWDVDGAMSMLLARSLVNKPC